MITRLPADLGFETTRESIVKNQRDVSIDVARGIGIILVVFGHTFQVYSVTSQVYAFHMPLFFLLSGLTFNTQKYLCDPWRFVKKNFLRLLVPYFGAAGLSYILYVFLAPILSLPDISVNAAISGILSGNGNTLPFNNVLWFLPALFCAGLIFLALRLLFKGTLLFIGVLLVSFSGIIIGLSYNFPFSLDIAMTTQFFIYFGYLFREGNWLEKLRRSKTNSALTYVGLAVALFAIMICLSAINGRIDLMTRIYGQPVIFFIAGLGGSVSVLMISLLFSIEGDKHHHVCWLLQTVGKASMYVFVSHTVIFYCLASIFALLWGFWIYYTYETYWYLLFVVGLSVPTVFHMLTKLVNKKRTIKHEIGS